MHDVIWNDSHAYHASDVYLQQIREVKVTEPQSSEAGLKTWARG